ncbi:MULTISPECIES: hypothetical protein [Candidatus Cardinium]|uniref:hypothetical protein n=1 Tax=Candidatus Cardinium TaxID=273135 RepID=UPI001FA9D78C|nr:MULTISPECIES: hypothetical protein [Cardinium]
MKTYTRYRAGLLAGLLILNTLSACVNVHTRKELGFSITAKLQRFHQRSQRLWNRSSPWAKVFYVTAALTLVLCPIVGWYVIYHHADVGHGANPIGLGPSPAPPLIPINHTTTEPVPPITDPTDNEKFVSSNSTEAPVSNKTKVPFTVEDPRRITEAILTYLKEQGFSIDSIKYAWEHGLYKDATDQNGCNLLHLISKSEQANDKPEVVTFLTEQAVNASSTC